MCFKKLLIRPKGDGSRLAVDANLSFQDQYFYSQGTNTDKQVINVEVNNRE